MELTIGDQLSYLVHEVEGEKVAHCPTLFGWYWRNQRRCYRRCQTPLVVATIMFALKSESLEAITHSAPPAVLGYVPCGFCQKTEQHRLPLIFRTQQNYSISECHYTYRWAVAA